MMTLLYKHGCGGSTIYRGAQGMLHFTMCCPACVSQITPFLGTWKCKEDISSGNRYHFVRNGCGCPLYENGCDSFTLYNVVLVVLFCVEMVAD